MNRLTQLALSLLTFGYVQPHNPVIPEQALLAESARNATKRIAIVGAGTAGISTLKTLLVDLPEEARRDWEVVLFEQRRDVGGIWLPDPNPPRPPVLPETPLYPRLKTNTPHPTMTIPKFTFRPGTALYPQHQPVYEYHADIVNHWNLSSHLKLNHEVLESKWKGSSTAGEWILQVKDRDQDVVRDFTFDHLIIANGHNHYPYEPKLEGRKRWEQSGVNRTVFHSIFYRNPEDYRGKNVVVVGGGASGRDVAQQVVGIANSTYVSLKAQNYTNLPFPDIPGAQYKPRIQHFTEHAVVFEDNSTLDHIDTVILGTGYEYRIPFLTAGGHLDINPGQPVPLPQDPESTHLNTNLRYIRPVYQHVLSLDTSYPLGSLYFIGLPIFVANAISDTAQALFAAHTLADPSLLESRDTLLADLHAQEARLRAAGLDPAYIGHRLVGDIGAAQYQDGLVAYLQARGRGGWPNIPALGQRFTDEWRTFGRNETLFLKKAWTRVEEYGQESVDKWLEGVETEEEWADLMVRLVKWEERKETEDGLFTAGEYRGPDWS
ncbi:FAD/NAD(P)-binding domain-containing protein [Dentipellis sp. KUC8613]|nr:FAD/NAD(P)-binding domain-containing protein [Dentipellis sp. KUC8613]